MSGLEMANQNGITSLNRSESRVRRPNRAFAKTLFIPCTLLFDNGSDCACVGFFGMQLSEVLITLSRLRAEWYSKTGSPGEITRART